MTAPGPPTGTASTTTTSDVVNASPSTVDPDDIATFDVRKKQAEVHRVHLNPMATFSISNDDDSASTKTAENVSNALSDGHDDPQSAVSHSNPSSQVTPYVVAQETAASMYKVDEDNEFVARAQLPEAPEAQRVLKANPLIDDDSVTMSRPKAKGRKVKGIRNDDDSVITISRSDHLLKDQAEWRRTFEIDDITRDEIKVVPTKSYNRETGEIEQVAKYTKTQRRKHQINTLAYEAQEKALQLAMRKSAAYKTKAQTQAKYGW